ncbi:unnamed protein product [Menidia menidia]|uniref:(Atlantic silverside) hypothetical protein n=1 Tax=Menidia menidia TaxID=238744 RepID=A0A8S4AWW8_9TELE|nr:unnamed protein product [Menidia menidia]
MASTAQTSEPEIPDNHRESWQALLAAAEAYGQKSGCDLALLTACRRFRPSGGGAGGQGGGEGGPAFPRECDFSYGVWGPGFLAESARRYVDDIGVLHSTTMLTAQRHTRPAGQEGGGAKQPPAPVDLTPDPGRRGSYPSIYSPGTTAAPSDGEEESTDGSLSEDAPPPLPTASRGMAVGPAAFSARHAQLALARSLPVSVPVWGCRGGRGQGDSNSGERALLAPGATDGTEMFGALPRPRLNTGDFSLKH